jgi:hypothetical protein
MRRRGVDLSGHRAASLNRYAAEKADVILTMTKGHKDSVLRKAPVAAEKVFTICVLQGTEGSVRALCRTAGRSHAVDRSVASTSLSHRSHTRISTRNSPEGGCGGFRSGPSKHGRRGLADAGAASPFRLSRHSSGDRSTGAPRRRPMLWLGDSHVRTVSSV